MNIIINKLEEGAEKVKEGYHSLTPDNQQRVVMFTAYVVSYTVSFVLARYIVRRRNNS